MAAIITMSCSSTVQAQTKTDNNMKSVIVYFTHSGNTELAAKKIAEVTGAALFVGRCQLGKRAIPLHTGTPQSVASTGY